MEINIRSVYKIDVPAEIMTILRFLSSPGTDPTLETKAECALVSWFLCASGRESFKEGNEPGMFNSDSMTCWFSFTRKTKAASLLLLNLRRQIFRARKSEIEIYNQTASEDVAN